MLDLNKIREETPHCKDKIFLNSAGASLMPNPVVNRIKSYLDEEVKYGGYDTYSRYEEEINQFYTAAGQLLNCSAKNIAFAFNATDAFAQALFSIPFDKGDVILTTDDDYVSNHAQFYMSYQRFGVQTIRINTLESGELDLMHLERLIREHHPKMVSVTHVPTNTGKVQDVEAVGKICEQYGTIYMVDACQSIGQMPIDVQKIKCDFLCVTGRKFLRGPRGTGFLYISDRILEREVAPLRIDAWSADWIAPNQFEYHPEAQRYEVFEQSYACTLGLKEAMQYANDLGVENIYRHNQTLLSRLRANLLEIADIQIMDQGDHLVNILTFQKTGIDQSRHEEVLRKNKVYYSIAFRGSALIDFDKKGETWAIRLSPHYFNTIEEMDLVAEIVREI